MVDGMPRLDAQGRAVVSVKGKTQQLDVLLGPNFRAIVLYSPNPANARGGGGGRGGGRGAAPPAPATAPPTPSEPSLPLTGARTPSPTGASSPSSRWSGSPIR